MLGLGLALLPGLGAIGAEGQAVLENKVKAACVFNFGVHTDWPDSAFASPEAPLVIGLVGEVPFAVALEQGLQGKSLGGRKVVLRTVDSTGEASQCHVLFIGAAKPERVDALLAALAAKPVLTVSEAQGFMQRGGMLNLVKVDGSIKFEANPAAAARAHLKLGSQLLKLARVVEGGRSGRKD
jgi:hypothetical protein